MDKYLDLDKMALDVVKIDLLCVSVQEKSHLTKHLASRYP